MMVSPTRPSLLCALLAVLTLGFLAGCSDAGSDAGRSGADRFAEAGLPDARPEGEVADRVLDALSEPDSIARVAALASLLTELGEPDVPEVVSAFEYAHPLLGDSEWMLLADWWTRIDDRAAYAWVLSNRDFKTPGVLRYVIAGMARRSPERALLALLTIRSLEEQQSVFNEIIKVWYETDPDAALDHIVHLTPGADRQRAISTLVAFKTRRKGIPSTRKWAEGLSEDLPDRFKLQTFRRVATELARIDPPAGRRWAEDHVGIQKGSGLYRRVAVMTVRDDPEGTLGWLQSLPAGEERDVAVEEAYRRWLRDDPEAAKGWMAGAPQERWRQPALEVYALSHAVADPSAALDLARGIRDPKRKQYTEMKTVIAWYARDSEAAEAWLDASDLPLQLRDKIHARVEQNEQRKQKREAQRKARELRRSQRESVSEP